MKAPIVYTKAASLGGAIKKYWGNLSGRTALQAEKSLYQGAPINLTGKMMHELPHSVAYKARKDRDMTRALTAIGVGGAGIGGYAYHKNKNRDTK